MNQVVIVRIYNGLGNQMFQYALGRHLALLNDAELKLDISAFRNDPLRKYELHHLSIAESLVDIDLSANIEEMELTRVVQKDRFFDPAVLLTRGNIYLRGYWQTEKYFSDIRPILQKEFELKASPDERNLELLSAITATDSVALHVRRSDYVSNPTSTDHHGVLPVQYYQEAIRRISDRVAQPVFFIFSDDPEWCEDNIKPHAQTFYVDTNDASQGQEDLRLMKQCKHFIIANSSFSWWGAWLSKNPDKIVIAPQRWFAKPQIDTRDMIPAGWIRI